MSRKGMNKLIGCIQHDCDECKAMNAAFKVAMKTLEQISTTPRNRGAKRNAYSTLMFLRTQLESAKLKAVS